MVSIYGTGKGRENVARDLAKKVDHCHHVPLADAAALGSSERHLDLAESLITAAEAQLDKSDYEDRATEALARAEELLQEAEERVEEFESLVTAVQTYEEEARAAGIEVSTALRPLGRAAVEPAPVSELLTDADEEANEAEAELRTVLRPSLGGVLRDRIASARRRMVAARERLDS